MVCTWVRRGWDADEQKSTRVRLALAMHLQPRRNSANLANLITYRSVLLLANACDCKPFVSTANSDYRGCVHTKAYDTVLVRSVFFSVPCLPSHLPSARHVLHRHSSVEIERSRERERHCWGPHNSHVLGGSLTKFVPPSLSPSALQQRLTRGKE